MDPYNQQQQQQQFMMYDPNQGAYNQGAQVYPMSPQSYAPVPQFQAPESDEDEEYDEERLTQAERELSEDAPWKKIQQNTFTRWVNEKLKAANDPNLLVENLQTDFKDGIKLARLVEILADKKIAGVTKKAKIQIQQFNNITAVLEFLKQEKIDLVTIDSSHINAGNMKLILALIWALILHYSIALARWNDEDDLEQSKGGRERLLKWMDNYVTGHYAGPKINNFNKDWNDGTKLGALVDSKAPGLCPEWDEWNPENAYENANTAMDLAQSYLDVPKLIAPEEIISPSVDDKAVMTYLSQFPKAKPKPDTPLKPFCKPKRARAFGPGVEPQGCVANQETYFTVETYGAGQGTVQVTVWDPSSNVVVSHVTFNNDYYKTYRVVYTPKVPGQHRVEVKWSGMGIKDSPFPVNVAGVMGDASKCRAVGPGLAVNGLQAQQPTHFDIFTDDAGSGAVEVFITDPNGQPDSVQMRIDRDSPTKYNVKYLAALSGPHLIKVTFNGRNIPGSQFTVNMGASTNKQPPRNDPRKVLVTGRGVQPKGLREGEPAVFSCFTKDAGQGELTISVLGPSGVQVSCTKDSKGNGEFECVYYPNNAGPYKVIVHFGGVDVPRSPFQVMVEKACTLRVIAYGPGLYGGQVGQPAAFTVDTRGEPDANLAFSIEGPSEAQIDAQDNGDGSCKAKYFPMVPGDYLIHITCNNEDIKDSPFNARITPSDTQGIDLSQIKVTGPGVETNGNSINKTTQIFIMFPPNSPIGPQFVSKITVLVLDRDGEYVPTSMPQMTEQSPAKFLVTFTPVKDQKHTVYVTVLQVSVAESPYQVYVDRGYDLSTVRVLNLEPVVKINVEEELEVTTPPEERLPPPKVLIRSPSRRITKGVIRHGYNGSYFVSFTPEEEGLHTISIYFGSMFFTELTTVAEVGADPSKVRAYGPGISEGEINIPAQFHVNTRGAGTGALGLEIEGPSEAHIECRDDSKGLCCISYLPTLPGEYMITVKFANEHIEGSPFRAYVTAKYDASKVKISGRGLQTGYVRVYDWAEARIDCSEAGEADLTYDILGPNGSLSGPIPSDISLQNDPGVYILKYQPQVEGYHTIVIKYGGQYVYKSPVKVLVKPYVDVSGIRVYKFWTEVFVEGYHDFIVDARGQVNRVGDEEVRVVIIAPSGKKTAAKVKTIGDGTYDVGYVLKEVGPHNIEVNYQGAPVPNSPFQVNAKKGRDAARVTAVGPGLKEGVVGKEAHFTVISKNAGPGSLGVYIEGPSEAKTTFKDNKDGTCSLAYLPTKPGEYNITIKYEDEFIPNSPFHAMIYPSETEMMNKPDPALVKVAGPCIKMSQPGSPIDHPATVFASEPQQFIVDASQTGVAPMRCNIKDPENRELPAQIADNRNGTFNVSWTPEDVGPHSINVSYGGQPISNSPFPVQSRPTGNPNGVIAPDIKKVIPVNQEYPFTVDASKAGRGNITCSADGPDGRRYPVMVNRRPNQQIYDCRFRPHLPGNYQLNIKFGGNHVKGSPFHILATDQPSQFAESPLSPAYAYPNQAGKPFSPMGAPGVNQPFDEDPLSPSSKPNANQQPYYPGPGQPFSPTGDQPGQGGPQGPGLGPTGAGTLPKAPVPQVGQKTPTEINVAPENIQPGQKLPPNAMTGEITTPSKRKMAPLLKNNDDETFAVDSAPVEVGKHQLVVRQNGREIRDSPFTFFVDSVENNKMSAYGPGLTAGVVFKPCYFTVITKNVRNPGGLKVTVQGPSRVDVQSTDKGDGTCLCQYTPTAPGEYQIEIFHDSKPLNGSPFTPKIQDPFNQLNQSPMSQAPGYGAPQRPGKGLGPKGPGVGTPGSDPVPEVGESTPCQVKVAPDNLQPGQILPEHCLAADVTTPLKNKAKPKLRGNDDGTFALDYVPTELGKHQLNVKQNGNEIKDSPFFFNVDSINDGKMSAYGPGLTAGIVNKVCYFTVLTKTVRNPGGLRVSVQGPAPTEVKCTDNGDGTCLCEYTPLTPGVYQIELFYEGNPLNGSPFTPKIQDPYNESPQSPRAQRPNDFYDQPYYDEDPMSPSKKPGVNQQPFYPGKPGTPGQNQPFSPSGNLPYQGAPGAGPGADNNLPKAPVPNVGQKTPCEVNVAPDDIAPGQKLPENCISGEIITPSKKKTAPKVHANDDGTFGVDYIPSELGKHYLTVRQNGREIKDCPFTFNVDSVNDGKMSAYGPGLTAGVVNKPCYFTIITRTVRNPGALKVSVKGPSEADVQYFDNGDGTCLCKYVPTAPGEYEIEVFHDGRPFNGSPYKPKIQDPHNQYPRRPESSGPYDQPYYDEDPLSPSKRPGVQQKPKGSLPKAPAPQVGQKTPCEVNVAPENVAPGQKVPEKAIAGEITTPSKRKTVPKLHSNDDGTFGIDYIPNELGKHQLAVRQNGKEIKDSPFFFNVDSVDDGKMSAYGPGLTSGIVFRPCYFNVLTKNVRNPGGLRVSVQGPSPTEVKCTDNGDDTCLCEYVPLAPGVYNIEIFADGKPLNGSPFTAKIQDPYNEAARGGPFDQPYYDEDPLSPSNKANLQKQPYYPGAPGQGGVPGGPKPGNLPKSPTPQIGQKTPCEVNIAPENVAPGQKIPETALIGELTTPSKRKAAPKMRSNDDGTFGIDYKPTEVGTHQLAVRQNGKEIKDSPFFINVDSVDDGKMSAYGPGLTSGIVFRPCYFNVLTKNVPNPGGLRVSIQGPAPTNVKCTDNGDGTCLCEYVPIAPGVYQIELFYDGRPLNGSPFYPKVQDPYSEAARGPGAQKAQPGSPFDQPYYDEGPLSPSTRTDTQRQPFYPGQPRPGVGPQGGNPVPQVGKNTPCQVNVAPENVAPGQYVPEQAMTGEITTPSKRKAVPKLVSNDDGTFAVDYIPTEVGNHVLAVRQNGKELDASPFFFNVDKLSDGKITAYGPGLTSGLVNQPCYFTVITKTARTSGGLKVSVQGPSRVEVECNDNGDGTCTCKYVPTAPGEYQIEIFSDARLINGSPFTPKIQDPYHQTGRPGPYRPKTVGPFDQPYADEDLMSPSSRPGINQKPFYPGRPNAATPGTPGQNRPYYPEDAIDSSNRPGVNQHPYYSGQSQPQSYSPLGKQPQGPGRSPRGPVPNITPQLGQMTPCTMTVAPESAIPGQIVPEETIAAEITTPSKRKAKPKIHSNDDGTISVDYVPSELGKHQLTLKQNGKEIEDSPFFFYVDIVTKGKVFAYGPGLTSGIVNQPCTFTVSTKTATGPGGLKVSVQGPSRVEVQCTDNGDGTCQCQFTPTAPGDYQIEIYFDGKPVNGSPFLSKVQDPFSPAKQAYIPMGSESRVTLKISEPDISVLTATIKPPSGSEEPCKLMRMSNGSIGVSFTPKEVGEHLVNVFKDGQHIPNSPFKITVSSAEIGDASKVRVWGPGTSKATTNEVARFNIDMSDAGYSNLSLSMEGPSQSNLDCTDTENGYCEVTYLPTEPGDYILNIKYGDKHVPGSPFNVHVTGVGSEPKFTERTSKTRRSETQLADIGNSCELSLSIPGVSPSDMSAQVISPTGKIEPATIGSDGRNKFQVSFVPEENGIHQVHVYHKDREIQGSPFQFTVGPLEDQGAAAVKAYGPGLQFAEANQPAEFVILTREAGGGSLSVAVEGPSKTDIELEDNKDGSCNILYYPTLPGEYQVNIKFNDQHIPNSPYKVQVVPGSAPIFPQPDAGLLPNEPASFVVTLPNVQSAREIEPRLVCPSGREVPCEVLRIDNQGNYAIKFVPTEDGDHRVDVYVWGAHVPGSPFLFKVGQARGDATRVFADGPGLYQGETGKPCEFIVNTCNAGKGTLQVTVDGPSRVTMDCREVDEGYCVSYVPHVPGEYVITIKYAGAYHINGSPFRASITGRAEPSYVAEQYITQQEVVTVDTVAKTRYSLSDQAANKKRVETSPGADADKVVCRGPALKRAQSNIMNSFQVDTSNAGESMLLVGCHGPTLPVDELIIKHVGSGRYDVRFKPAQPGDHVISVKWNDKHVPGSPFLAICT